jgi:hypothetical protein
MCAQPRPANGEQRERRAKLAREVMHLKMRSVRPNSFAAAASSVDCSSASEAERTGGCGEGIEWPKERGSRSFSWGVSFRGNRKHCNEPMSLLRGRQALDLQRSVPSARALRKLACPDARDRDTGRDLFDSRRTRLASSARPRCAFAAIGIQ